MRHLSRKVVLVVTGIATALMLINVTNRTVIDKTGLAGLYDIQLEDTLRSLILVYGPADQSV